MKLFKDDNFIEMEVFLEQKQHIFCEDFQKYQNLSIKQILQINFLEAKIFFFNILDNNFLGANILHLCETFS